jgi:AcrR family transcriptional regulator
LEIFSVRHPAFGRRETSPSPEASGDHILFQKATPFVAKATEAAERRYHASNRPGAAFTGIGRSAGRREGKAIETSENSNLAPDREGIAGVARLQAPTERDRIVQAMIECCAERGYLETSVEDVLARADVRAESFAALFADKEECALAALRKISSEVMTSSGAGATAERSRSRNLLGIKALVELIASQPGYAYLGCVEARQGGTAQMHEIYESSARVLSAMIERAPEAELAASASPGAVRAALGGAEAVVRREIAAGRVAQLSRLGPDLLYGVLAPLLGQQEALRQRRALRELFEEGA